MPAETHAAASPPAWDTGTAHSAFPLDLTESIQRFDESKLAREAFGEGVRDHIAGMARHELLLARQAVTDWELQNGFEPA